MSIMIEILVEIPYPYHGPWRAVPCISICMRSFKDEGDASNQSKD